MKKLTGPDQYLMEHEEEGKRLHLNRRADRLRAHLQEARIADLPPDPVLVDAGSGSGFVSGIAAELIADRHPGYRLILLDFSKLRLDEAKEGLAGKAKGHCRFIQTNLENIPLADDTADFIFSTFVFEFLYDPERCFGELHRILKPGGKLLIVDLDYNCLTHYPLSEKLERRLREIAETLTAMRLFDVNVGRKLYSWFHAKGMKQIEVRLSAHHLFYGDLPSSDEYNWTAKLDQLASLQEKGLIEFTFPVAEFKEEFLQMLKSPARFSYTPCIAVEGRK